MNPARELNVPESKRKGMDRKSNQMKILQGVSLAPGIAEGTICLYSSETEKGIPHYAIPPERVSHEVALLKAAFNRSREAMRQMIEVAEKNLDKKAVEIFHTHLVILNDPGLHEKIVQLICDQRVNAEHAITEVFNEYIEKYENKGEHFKELTHDFVDTRNRILSAFRGETARFKCPVGEKKPVLVVTQILTPSMVLNIPRENVLAFITKEGGYTSHATILARALGVPMIFGIGVDKETDCGMQAIVDGSAGRLILSPDKKTRRYYQKKLKGMRQKRDFCELRKGMLVQTGEGKRVKLRLNINTPGEMEMGKEMMHDGIGLLRTEFLFADRKELPSEEDQLIMYQRILHSCPGKRVTLRLLDIGADKLPPYLHLPEGANTDLGFRGALAVETFPEIYLTQVKALLRANTHSNLRLLYPMVSDLKDLKTFKDILFLARKSLKRSRIPLVDKGPEEGVMIETPAAVMLAEELMQEVDFVNIGSNDLLQYTLAAARGNLLVEKRYHVLHPALVRLLELLVKAGRKTKKEVCLCGHIASFEEFYPLFLQIGLKSFSVAVSKFPDIKCELLHLHKTKDRQLLRSYYMNRTKEEIDSYFNLHT